MLNISIPTTKPLFSQRDEPCFRKKNKSCAQSWPGVFREHIVPNLPADEVGYKLYCRFNGRPTNNITVMISLLIYQEFMGLTDQETVDGLFDSYKLQYALGIENPTDDAVMVSRRSYWEFRNKVKDASLAELIFDSVNLRLLDEFNVNTDTVRLDSTHFITNMKSLTRGCLFHKTISRFLSKLSRKDPEQFELIDPELVSRYPKKQTGYDYFGQVKAGRRAKVLEDMARDLLALVRLFEDHPVVSAMAEFSLLVRLLFEQCDITPASADSSAETVAPKNPKDVPSDSLQSPTDPDATYDGHKGKGFQAQIYESCSDDEKGGLHLILGTITQPAHVHDSAAVAEVIGDLQDKGIQPKTMLGDTSYGSDENVALAANAGVELVSPVPGNAPASEEGSGKLGLADFGTDENGALAVCPMGQTGRVIEKDGGRHTTYFHKNICAACPRLGGCPVKIGKFRAVLSYSDKGLRIDRRRKDQKSPDFKKRYRLRSGIEATNSLMKRKFGLNRVRYRGLKAAGPSVCYKALAVNLWRIAAFERRKMRI